MCYYFIYKVYSKQDYSRLRPCRSPSLKTYRPGYHSPKPGPNGWLDFDWCFNVCKKDTNTSTGCVHKDERDDLLCVAAASAQATYSKSTENGASVCLLTADKLRWLHERSWITGASTIQGHRRILGKLGAQGRSPLQRSYPWCHGMSRNKSADYLLRTLLAPVPSVPTRS